MFPRIGSGAAFVMFLDPIRFEDHVFAGVDEILRELKRFESRVNGYPNFIGISGWPAEGGNARFEWNITVQRFELSASKENGKTASK